MRRIVGVFICGFVFLCACASRADYAGLGGAMQIKQQSKEEAECNKAKGMCPTKYVKIDPFQSKDDNDFLYTNKAARDSVSNTKCVTLRSADVYECDYSYCGRNYLVEMPANHFFEGKTVSKKKFYVCDISGGDSWEPTNETITDCTSAEKTSQHAVQVTANNGNKYLIISTDVTKKPNKKICLLKKKETETKKTTATKKQDEKKNEDCDGVPHGNKGQVDCPDSEEYQNADKCNATCNNGKLEDYTVLTCGNGYFLKDAKCIAYGSECDEVDAAKQNATVGKYVTDGKGGYVCAATQCKKGAYLVVKDSVPQGWCVYGTYCKNKQNTKLNIIDNIKTDLTCVPIEESVQGNASTDSQRFNNNNTSGSSSGAVISSVSTGANGNGGDESNADNDDNSNNNSGQAGNNGGGAYVTPDKTGPENGTACESTDKNATAGIWHNGVCVPALCRGGFEIVKYVCVEIGGDCDEMPENASAAHRAWDAQGGRVVCVIDDCEKNYNLSDDKMTCEQDKKAVAQDALDKAKAKEQSTANKLLGGATMAATGIGGMQAMSAMAEQSADADAEEAMRAYLATFHCNYGGGINIPGGEKDVQLPGGNELVGLYSEYVNLANDLKVRKNALGMKPGIESESILDSATSGLYDDVAIGKTSGAFTSLARAMMDPNGADAAAWAAQKSDTANKLKTGATMAGIGAVGGAVGNLLINNDKDDDKSKNSDAKKEDKKFDKQKVGQDDVKKLTDTVKQKVSKSQQQKSGGQNESQNQVAADAVVVASVTEISDGNVIAQDIDNSNITDSNAMLDALAQEFGKTPSDSVRAAWNKFAEQCEEYEGILSLEESNAHAGGYELLCEFVDLKQTDENIKKFYATELGHEYFTKKNIDRKLQIEKWMSIKIRIMGKMI